MFLTELRGAQHALLFYHAVCPPPLLQNPFDIPLLFASDLGLLLLVVQDLQLVMVQLRLQFQFSCFDQFILGMDPFSPFNPYFGHLLGPTHDCKHQIAAVGHDTRNHQDYVHLANLVLLDIIGGVVGERVGKTRNQVDGQLVDQQEYVCEAVEHRLSDQHVRKHNQLQDHDEVDLNCG